MLHRTDITSQLQMTMADLLTVCVSYQPVLYDKLKKYKANVTNAQTVYMFLGFTDTELYLLHPPKLSSKPPDYFNKNSHFNSQNTGDGGLLLPHSVSL